MPEKERCEQYEDCQARKIEHASFQATVLQTLKNIEDKMTDYKTERKDEIKEIWEAIGGIRKDIKELYWRIGLISGGTAAVTSIATSMILKAINH